MIRSVPFLSTLPCTTHFSLLLLLCVLNLQLNPLSIYCYCPPIIFLLFCISGSFLLNTQIFKKIFGLLGCADFMNKCLLFSIPDQMYIFSSPAGCQIRFMYQNELYLILFWALYITTSSIYMYLLSSLFILIRFWLTALFVLCRHYETQVIRNINRLSLSRVWIFGLMLEMV